MINNTLPESIQHILSDYVNFYERISLRIIFMTIL